MKRRIFLSILCILVIQGITGNITAQTSDQKKEEEHRPQIHFSPKENWMNDPNGMVYHKGIYHLFFQYHPYSSVWGPMHWGHATSKDMIHWNREPTAIYPDSLGTIFSGSAVVDENNTSGFGSNGQAPLVAIFTHHDPIGEKKGNNDFQNQSIAYSLDEGKTWTKYAGNPVVKNPGIKDFRDPKVSWYEAGKKWIMTLATLDHITFYSSPNLRDWTKESEFGKELGAHGGVWECPDLFPLNYNGQEIWVLFVSINPGGPNGGSATQFFTGQFDGNKFTTSQTDTRWIDYGPDNYAGITWANTGSRKIFLGWMSNWLYAQQVPTPKWRSATTLPRDLKLKQVGKEIFVTSQPVPELSKIYSKPVIAENIQLTKSMDIAGKTGKVNFPCRLNLDMEEIKDFSVVVSNDMGEEIIIGYDKNMNQYYIDRTKSGKIAFQKDFAARHMAPRLAENTKMNVTLVIDVSSVELFADDGLTVMTSIFFPNKSYSQIHIQSPDIILIKKLEYINLNSIWR